ncbi:hypothetical protein ACI2KS_27730 [Pseudomonas sp. NPDC087358]|uniref:hypothetical protein n=1 Tax=Pseudomonas sp. NPDC087358 TaxID=3364439 RepID=UPI00384DB75E
MGARLASDLPGTGSKIQRLGCVSQTLLAETTAGARQIVGKPDSHAFGRIKDRYNIQVQA